MGKMPWFRFYASDWLTGTRGLTATETGIYITLMASMYDKLGPLVNDTSALARLCGCTPKKLKSAVDKFIAAGKLYVTNGMLGNKKADEQIRSYISKSEKAKCSIDVRWNDKTKQKQCHSDTNVSNSKYVIDTNQNQNQNQNKIDDRRARARLDDDELLKKLREAAGWQNEPAPGLFVTGPVVEAMAKGVDLELDIIPACKAHGPVLRSRSSWIYILKAAISSRDQRISVSDDAGKTKGKINGKPQKPQRSEIARIAGNDVRRALGITEVDENPRHKFTDAIDVQFSESG